MFRHDTPAETEFRMDVRTWLEANLPAALRGRTTRPPPAELMPWYHTLSRKGWIAPHWPKQYGGMGATLTGAAITTDGLHLVQVGDSRGYVIRGAEIKLATKDQSLVQQLVDVGQISEQEAETHMFRNVILQALGAQAELTPVTGRVRLFQNDLLLLCSDGLSGKLRAEDMLRIVSESNGDLQLACEHLIQEANDRGGEDNITVVLARVGGEELASPDSNRITVENISASPDYMAGRDDDTTEYP